MQRSLHSPRALVAAAFAVIAALALLAVLDRSSDGLKSPLASESALAAQAPLESPGAFVPAQRTAEPAGRVNPLVPLPARGTPVLEVRSGAAVELRSSPGGDLVAELGSVTEFGSPTVLTVLERRGNWAGVPSELLPNGELGWVELDSNAIEIDTVGESIEVDLSRMEATLSAGPKLLHTWTVSVGAPDSPTPTGRFSITDKITENLNPVYGCCALALSATQPNPPEGWTAGTRMAMHGTSMPLGEANSAGCVRSGEQDLWMLIEAAPLGTPITIHR